MRYFTISQSEKLRNVISIWGFHERSRINFTRQELEQVKDVMIFYFEGSEESIFPDLITFPVYLISAKMKKIIESYEAGVIFKPCILINLENRIQKTYYLLSLDPVDCISNETTYYHNGWIERLVIDSRRAQSKWIFQISTAGNDYLIAAMDVTESMLRRNPQGIVIKEIPCM